MIKYNILAIIIYCIYMLMWFIELVFLRIFIFLFVEEYINLYNGETETNTYIVNKKIIPTPIKNKG